VQQGFSKSTPQSKERIEPVKQKKGILSQFLGLSFPHFVPFFPTLGVILNIKM